MCMILAVSAATLLDEELAAFIQGGVSILAASRDARLVPSLARAVGCRAAPGRPHVAVFLLASQSGALLADYRANGAIAVVFSQPSTHRTLQLKGSDAAPEPLEEGDWVRVARYREALTAELVAIGHLGALGRALLAGDRGDLVAVGFTVSAAFEQTPGPAAGTALGP